MAMYLRAVVVPYKFDVGSSEIVWDDPIGAKELQQSSARKFRQFDNTDVVDVRDSEALMRIVNLLPRVRTGMQIPSLPDQDRTFERSESMTTEVSSREEDESLSSLKEPVPAPRRCGGKTSAQRYVADLVNELEAWEEDPSTTDRERFVNLLAVRQSTTNLIADLNFQLDVCRYDGGAGQEIQRLQHDLSPFEAFNKRIKIRITAILQGRPKNSSKSYDSLNASGTISSKLRPGEEMMETDDWMGTGDKRELKLTLERH